MEKKKVLQKLLNGTATKKEVELLKQALANGEIFIGRDVNRSVVIIGSGNKVELTSEALSLLKPDASIEEPVEGEPPYMGLRYFDTADADLFYGRESLTRELAERVSKESFLAIVGASGSGKSSVARAGLIPMWKKEHVERGVVYVITPTAHPLESLAASLTRDSVSVTETSTLIDDLKNDARGLRLHVRKMLSRSRESHMLLVVDQFEEIFTLCTDLAERKSFIENLLSLADEENNVAHVVITLRADFYHLCDKYEGLRSALGAHQEFIGEMTQDELREAITAPAENNGWGFQARLVDLILEDVGIEPGALPLLSHALLETWKRKQGNTLTLQGYYEAGRVKKAITQTAESVYNKLSQEDQTIARNIILRLTELGEGGQYTRRRVKIKELGQAKAPEAVARVLNTLTDARLVTTEQDSAEVAHEALIREWGTLRKWLDENHESLLIHRHVFDSSLTWERNQKDAGDLYRGSRLIQALEWAKSHSSELNTLELEYIRACQAEHSKERRRTQSRWAGILGAIVFSLVTGGLALTGQLNLFIYRPLSIEWITVPAGYFQMGSDNGDSSERPIHAVFLDSFEIGKYEVTNEQYYQCVKAGVCSLPRNDRYNSSEYSDHPVTDVSWIDANAFCEWNDRNGRLPSEAEWEKAASWNEKKQQKHIYPWGNDSIDCSFANHLGENGACAGDTTSVGSYPEGQSPYGVHDMAGNVLEWVADWYSVNYYATSPNSNPVGPASGEYRVLRGGMWNSGEYNLRTSTRLWYLPSYSDAIFSGFRCARDIDTQ